MIAIKYPAVERQLVPITPFTFHDMLPPAMTDKEIRAVLADVTYKRAWHIDLVGPGRIIIVNPDTDSRVDAMTAVDVELLGGTLHSPEHVLDVVGQTICDMEDHEFKEWFRYQGRSVLDPHPELQLPL